MGYNLIETDAREIGFDVKLFKSPHGDYLHIISTELPSFEKLSAFLICLKNDFHISYFDFFHPQLSDPGAYVLAVNKDSEFYFMKGNHGWSSKWKLITVEELCDSIIKNWSKKDPDGYYKDYIEVHKNKYDYPRL